MKTTIDAGIMARALGALGAMKNAWFGASEPMSPLVTNPEQIESVRGRQFDFPVALNRNVTPRSTESVSFNTLRQLADRCDILRLVIETRKDQLAKMKWVIKPTDPKAKPDATSEKLTAFFKSPDQEHDWDTWLRMLLEEVFVTDAPALYVRKRNNGDMYALEPLDGATIKRVLDDHGRTPMAPDPAYQQVLKGIPAINYSTDELLYRPRNLRVWKVYGYSPVEQILMTVNTALRRSVHVMQYYTEGNVPEALIALPETWSMDQIKEFQEYWDLMLEGDTAQRRHAKFIPGDMKYQPTKTDVLKDEFDEWLARVVCFAFSISPTPFVKQVNRATAGTSHEAALEEGLAPIMQWVKNLIDHALHTTFNITDYEFAWHDDTEQDPEVAAAIAKIYIDAGVLLPDEVRADIGREPFTADQLAAIAEQKAAAAAQFGAGPPGEDDDDPTNEKVAKAKKPRPGPISPDRATVVRLERKLAKAFKTFFDAQLAKIGKADDDLALKITVDFDELVPEIEPILASIARAGGRSALEQIGLTGADVKFGAQTTAWAKDRAAELVGKKWVDGSLVDNPNAEWVISDSTRDMINDAVAAATDEGLTMDELADRLSIGGALSEERAMMIARTETRLADAAGQMEAYVTSDVVRGTEWTTAQDDAVSDECNENADAGMVELGELYPSGDAAPPAHPNCRCSLSAVLKNE